MKYQTLPTKKEEQQQSKAPDLKLRAGNVSVCGWKNSAEKDGRSFEFYTISVQRSYLDTDGKTWKNTQSFRTNDLLKLAALLTEMHSKIAVTSGGAADADTSE